MSYTGRLAPSPTGLLHLGHARTFWIAYQRARIAGGTLLLRNEDLDRQRAREEFVTAMREDLRWLGVIWNGELRQSDRLPAYRAAMQQLVARGLAYPCTCSRKDLAQSITAPHEDTDDEPIYTGRCRPQRSPNMSTDPPAEPASIMPQLFDEYGNYRFRVPDGLTVRFHDGNAGPQTFTPGCTAAADFGDFLIWRKDGLPSYQLACVVDDSFQQITEVVRGRDLLKSTARQILLQQALGLPTPAYFHTDLMRDAQGTRLAKRHDALSLRALRQQGMTPDQVRAMF